MFHCVAAGSFALLLAVISVPAQAQDEGAQTPDQLCAAAVPAPEPAATSFEAPEQVLEPGTDYRAILCTGAGPVYVDLFEQFTPQAVNNFVFLAQVGFYNNTTFHRVIADFMAQGGDPTATGTGGPGYRFADEPVGFLTFEEPGWLAMANAGPNSNGSQFFITTAPATHLDYQHTIFGEVLAGAENVANIRLRDPASDPAPGTSLDTVLIITDPAVVDAEVTALTPSTEADFQSAIDALAEEIGEPLQANAEATGILDAEALLASFPAEAQDALNALLEANNFAFAARHRIDNAGCDLQNFPYAYMQATFLVFESEADAAAVLADPAWSAQYTEAGYAETPSQAFTAPIYTLAETGCDQPMERAVVSYQRGREIVSAEIVYFPPAGATAEQWLQGYVALLYERFFRQPLLADRRS
jgi:cyclophilin family peptidyl-prolyl cis-trans isomerase